MMPLLFRQCFLRKRLMRSVGGCLFLRKNVHIYLVAASMMSRYAVYPSLLANACWLPFVMSFPFTNARSIWNVVPGRKVSRLDLLC